MLYEALGEGLTYDSGIDTPDMPSDSYIANAIQFALQKGYIAIYDDETFRPDRNLTRAECATIVCNAASLPLDINTDIIDVPDDHWAYRLICAILHYSYMQLYEDGTFRPNDFVLYSDAQRAVSPALN